MPGPPSSYIHGFLDGKERMETLTRDEVVKSAFQYRDALTSTAFAILRDGSLAEDVVQDAFIVVMNKWTDFKPGTSVYHWVRQIVHHKTMEALRARGRKVSALDQELLDQVAATVERYLDEPGAERQRFMREALRHCMSALNDRAVDMLAGFYGHAKSCEDIAQLQNRSVNSIRLALSRVRKQLHECMSRKLPLLEARG